MPLMLLRSHVDEASPHRCQFEFDEASRAHSGLERCRTNATLFFVHLVWRAARRDAIAATSRDKGSTTGGNQLAGCFNSRRACATCWQSVAEDESRVGIE